MKVAFTSHDLPASNAVCVGVTADRTLSESARKLDELAGGALSRAIKASGRFKGDKRQLLEVLAPAGVENSRVLLVGLGKPDALDAGELEAIGGELVAKLNAAGESQATFVLDQLAGAPVSGPQAAARLGLGARLRSYRFDKYRTQEKAEDKPTLTQFTLALSHRKDAETAYQSLEKVADGVEMTRDLVSEPANVLTPENLAAECRKLEELGVEVEVLDAKAMRKLSMGALLAVAQGSDKEPKLVTMRWQGGSGKKTPLAVVGKGVCFDTGGLSLKPAQGMGDMKWDMGGAGRHRRPAQGAGRAQGEAERGRRGRPGGEHAGRGRLPPGRRADLDVRPDDRGAQHRRRRAGSCWPTRSGTRSRPTSRRRWSTWRP